MTSLLGCARDLVSADLPDRVDPLPGLNGRVVEAHFVGRRLEVGEGEAHCRGKDSLCGVVMQLRPGCIHRALAGWVLAAQLEHLDHQVGREVPASYAIRREAAGV